MITMRLTLGLFLTAAFKMLVVPILAGRIMCSQTPAGARRYKGEAMWRIPSTSLTASSNAPSYNKHFVKRLHLEGRECTFARSSTTTYWNRSPASLNTRLRLSPLARVLTVPRTRNPRRRSSSMQWDAI